VFGEIVENKREIIGGLENGELVVQKPAAGLREGAYVQIVQK
jgi:hypothetical protein